MRAFLAIALYVHTVACGGRPEREVPAKEQGSAVTPPAIPPPAIVDASLDAAPQVATLDAADPKAPRCGKRQCAATEYCTVLRYTGGVAGTPTELEYKCTPLPAECRQQADCNCVARSFIGGSFRCEDKDGFAFVTMQMSSP